jgi:hypothetical protein
MTTCNPTPNKSNSKKGKKVKFNKIQLSSVQKDTKQLIIRARQASRLVRDVMLKGTAFGVFPY